jgi:hypothetical protein
MINRIPALLIGIGLACQPAQAAEWRYIGESVKGSVYYIDTSSIRDASDTLWHESFKLAWFKLDHTNDKSVKHRTSKQLHRFKCDEQSSMLNQAILYDSNDSVIDRLTVRVSAFEAVAPETMNSAMLKAACFGDYVE